MSTPSRALPVDPDEGEVELPVTEGLDETVGVPFDERDVDAGITIVELGQQLGQNRQGTAAHHAHRDLPVHMLQLNRRGEKPAGAIDVDAAQPLNHVVDELLGLAR